jgi:hypothetical protein
MHYLLVCYSAKYRLSAAAARATNAQCVSFSTAAVQCSTEGTASTAACTCATVTQYCRKLGESYLKYYTN